MENTYLQTQHLFASSRQPRIICNCKTSALIDSNGSIVWMAVPNPHSKPVFMSITAPEKGGSFSIKLRNSGSELEPSSSSQEYVGNSNVLKTTLDFAAGIKLVITDFMPDNKSLLIRKLSITSSKNCSVNLDLDIKVNPEVSAAVEDHGKAVIYHNQLSSFAVTKLPKTVNLIQNQEKNFNVVLTYNNVTDLNVTDREIDSLYDKTLSNFDSTLSGFDSIINPSFKPQTFRMILTLLSLIDRNSGVILASPTTSIPSVPGGVENWDYRYVWIRDSSYVMEALLDLKLFEKTKTMIDFFLNLQEPNGNWKHPFYTIDGDKPSHETISDLHQTADGRMVRYGNKAAYQRQLDATPHIIRIFRDYVSRTNDLDYAITNWNKIKAAANAIVKDIGKRDSGIWEVRSQSEGNEWFNLGQKHFTYSKVLQYAGLVAANEIGKKIGKEHNHSWQNEAQALKNEVLKKSWSKERKSYVQTYDGPAVVDISVLSLVQHGLVEVDSRKWQSTHRQVVRNLILDGGVRRHEMATSCFYPASFWWAEYLANCGNVQESTDIVQQCMNSSATGLLAEHHLNGSYPLQLGNTPLAWSMAGAIKSIFAISKQVVDGNGRL